MLIKEYRVVLPLTVEEYQVGQLWSTAQASLENTGGGEGIEVLKNEPFTEEPAIPLLGHRSAGQYTHKIYHLRERVPFIVRAVAPKNALELVEEAWNAYPYCRTVVTNPGYMKDGFVIKIETIHLQDNGTAENAHELDDEKLKMREVVPIDIANDHIRPKDYKENEDPSKYHSNKTGRGPLTGNWQPGSEPLMCAYKLVTVEFKWWGLQNKVERFLQDFERRLFTNFHRLVFCNLDNWHGLTMDDIRRMEDETKHNLDQQRKEGQIRGMAE